MKKSCGKTVMELGYQISLHDRWLSCDKCGIYGSALVFACFRWETIILISMYGIYIIIMK